jgi:ABC-type glycerol-3-phosphate transport system permease component
MAEPTNEEKKRTTYAGTQKEPVNWHHMKNNVKVLVITLFTLAILFIYLSPFAFMVFTSLKTQEQISIVGSPIWPARQPVVEIDGRNAEVFTVPVNTCEGFEDESGNRNLAMVQRGTRVSTFVTRMSPNWGISSVRFPGAL